MKKIKVALVGNPNVGKTSLLNHLAGTDLKIGNWPGVTVEKKVGKTTFQDYEIEFVDLPGIYTLEKAFSEDEFIAINYLKEGDYDVILNIIESPRLERDLYLTLQLFELKKPLLIALNMKDEAEALGIYIDEKGLSNLFKIKAIKTVGKTGEGKKELLLAIVETFENKLVPQIEIFSFSPEENSEEKRLSLIKGICAEVVRRKLITKKNFTEILDQFLLHPYLGFFFLFIILYVTFKLVFDLSSPFVDFIDGFFQKFLSPALALGLQSLGASDFIINFCTDALLGGLGIVLSFLPLIFVMFFFITLLETSGYLPRVAFLVDRFTHKIGLHGQSVIPLILGFGCNVPAILATRTVQDRKDRLLIIAMIPFMSCSARLVVFSFFALTFFSKPVYLILALYFLGIVLAFLTGFVLKKTLFQKELSHFIMDLPPYRFPSLKVLFRIVNLHVKHFLLRAGTIIFVIALVVWLTLNLPPGEKELENTLAGNIGRALTPLFEPVGLGDWRITTSLIPAFLAREAILSNLGVILKVEEKEEPKEIKIIPALKEQGMALLEAFKEAFTSLFTLTPVSLKAEEEGPLRSKIKELLTSSSALSFLIFVLIYNSCVATFVTMWKEGSRNLALGFLLYSFLLAWILAFITYRIF
ncbi:MAG: ferrous iron transport protein B [Caldimicrobium thiodismutans]|jgi:ferrous iron transport protein B|uniref:Ferrous iron transport protein B n=1 Tax=Caldimicrobium thiodismutans TaxID=1653476 RepID=A0A2N7PIM7_9BACT|nr:MAG: ferrous iron transport protein B [Caldimicrobium thiodismutans]